MREGLEARLGTVSVATRWAPFTHYKLVYLAKLTRVNYQLQWFITQVITARGSPCKHDWPVVNRLNHCEWFVINLFRCSRMVPYWFTMVG